MSCQKGPNARQDIDHFLMCMSCQKGPNARKNIGHF